MLPRPVTVSPVKSGAPPWYHPGRSGTLALGPKVLAYFGEFHPGVVGALAKGVRRVTAVLLFLAATRT